MTAQDLATKMKTIEAKFADLQGALQKKQGEITTIKEEMLKVQGEYRLIKALRDECPVEAEVKPVETRKAK